MKTCHNMLSNRDFLLGVFLHTATNIALGYSKYNPTLIPTIAAAVFAGGIFAATQQGHLNKRVAKIIIVLPGTFCAYNSIFPTFDAACKQLLPNGGYLR